MWNIIWKRNPATLTYVSLYMFAPSASHNSICPLYRKKDLLKTNNAEDTNTILNSNITCTFLWFRSRKQRHRTKFDKSSNKYGGHFYYSVFSLIFGLHLHQKWKLKLNRSPMKKTILIKTPSDIRNNCIWFVNKKARTS